MKIARTIVTALMLSFAVFSFAQGNDSIAILPINSGKEFCKITKSIKDKNNALYVFDIDNTLLVTNENLFGSDWWYSQAKEDSSLKLNVSNSCLFDVLTPLFYSMFNTASLFKKQACAVNSLLKNKSKTIALTSRAYTPTIAASTELELINNQFHFLQKDSIELAPNVVMLNGVIYTKGQNKGIILYNYIKGTEYEHIYYFDDSEGKVKDVQKVFSGKNIDISIYHMKIAQKVPYDQAQKEYMEEKLCFLINTINQHAEPICKCK